MVRWTLLLFAQTFRRFWRCLMFKCVHFQENWSYILFNVYLWIFQDITYRVLEFLCKTVWVHWTPTFRMSTLDTSFHMILEKCIYYVQHLFFEHLRTCIYDEFVQVSLTLCELCALFSRLKPPLSLFFSPSEPSSSQNSVSKI